MEHHVALGAVRGLDPRLIDLGSHCLKRFQIHPVVIVGQFPGGEVVHASCQQSLPG